MPKDDNGGFTLDNIVETGVEMKNGGEYFDNDDLKRQESQLS